MSVPLQIEGPIVCNKNLYEVLNTILVLCLYSFFPIKPFEFENGIFTPLKLTFKKLKNVSQATWKSNMSQESIITKFS